MKLIVGLGNPGAEYAETRHNAGFMVTDELAKRSGVTFRASGKWQAKTARTAEGDRDVLIAEPLTFMNLSGFAVRELLGFYKLAVADMLVIVDDADLPLGRLRIRANGSAGGHNGLKSIIQEIGTDQFSRLRIGVGRQSGELRNHVLGRFAADERDQIASAIQKAADAAEMFVSDGILKAMNRYNVAESQSAE